MALGKTLRSIPRGSQLSADKAYDIPWFRIRLMCLGIEANIQYRAIWYQHLKERKPEKPPTNPLVYYQRYRIERTFAWFTKFKRLNIRYERLPQLYKDFWFLASAILIIDRFLK